jgi:mRNA interferase MazF
MTASSFSFGDIVLVYFPFTNQSSGKKRPAVVVSSRAYQQSRPDVILLAVTSQVANPGPEDVPVMHWQEAGLLKPSLFKPLLATVERPLLSRKLGRLLSDDRRALESLLDRILGSSEDP